MKKLVTDVLVIGGGGAALRGAIEAKQAGAQVLVVQKGIGSTAYKVAETAGYNSPDGQVDPEDNAEEFLKDILEAALGTCDEQLARILAQEAEATVGYLESHGAEFEYDGDRYLEVIGCFGNRPRMHILKGHGEPIVKALKGLLAKEGIQVLGNVMVTKIFTKDNKVVGALCLDVAGEELFFVHCKAIILGTGGAGQLFKLNHNPPDVTGDGYLLALEAGARLVNMEFMQSGLGTVKPIKVNFNNWIWAGYPRILNKKGDEFLANYVPEGVTLQESMDDKSKHYPFSSRDLSKYIEEGIHKEIKKGNGTENHGVYVDFSPLLEMSTEEMPDHMQKLWPMTRQFWESHGVDLSQDRIEIATFGHAINGGVQIDENSQSTVQGLYAAGEAAGGPHGADRLGGNMLVTCQVFGARAGRDSANYAKEEKLMEITQEEVQVEIQKLTDLIGKSGEKSLDEIKTDLQDLMWNNYLVVKNEETLNNVKQGLVSLTEDLAQARIGNHRDLRIYLELQNMFQLAEMMTEAALLRRESRGSHYRDDYNTVVDELAKPIFIEGTRGDFQLDFGKY